MHRFGYCYDLPGFRFRPRHAFAQSAPEGVRMHFGTGRQASVGRFMTGARVFGMWQWTEGQFNNKPTVACYGPTELSSRSYAGGHFNGLSCSASTPTNNPFPVQVIMRCRQKLGSLNGLSRCSAQQLTINDIHVRRLCVLC